MSTLETRAYSNKKPIDNQWIRENETTEFYYNNNDKQEDFQNMKEAQVILEGIRALKGKEIEELKNVREKLKKIEAETETNENYYYDGEYLFETEKEHEKEIERIMG